MKNASSFDSFMIIKNVVGLDFLINELNVHKGTIKRWEQQKAVPKNYDFDLEKLIKKIESEYPNIDIVRLKSNNLSNERKFDEFYTTSKTAKYCFGILKNKLKELKLNINEFSFIEPSAGAGSFYNVMPENNRLGV